MVMDSSDLLPPIAPVLMPSLSSVMANWDNPELKRDEIMDWTKAPPGTLLDTLLPLHPSLSRFPSQQPSLIMTISTAAAAAPHISHNHDDIIRHDDSLLSFDHLMPPHATTMLSHDSTQLTRFDSRYQHHTLPPLSLFAQHSIDKSFTPFTTSTTSAFTTTTTSQPRISFEQMNSRDVTSKVHAAATLANDMTPLHATNVKQESDESDDEGHDHDMTQTQQQHPQQRTCKKRKRRLSEDSDPDYDEDGQDDYVDDAEIEVASHSSHSSSPSPHHTSTSGAPQHIRIRTSEDSAHHKKRQAVTKYKRTHKRVQRGQQLVLKSTDNRANYKVAVCKQYYNDKWCVRLVTATDTTTHETYRFVHGPDVAGLVKRKSNISRLLGQYSSPTEKMIMNVPSARCPNTGQPSNVLTLIGLNRLIREEIVHHDRAYATWLMKTCIPYLEGTVNHEMDA